MDRTELIRVHKTMVSPPKEIKERELRKNDDILYNFFEGIDFLELENLLPEYVNVFYENLDNPEFLNDFSVALIDIALEIKALLDTNQEIPDKYKTYVIK